MRSVDISSEIQEAAYELMDRGRPVFPISGEKVPFRNCEPCKGKVDEAHRNACECLRNGELCHGFYAATLERDIWDAWMERESDVEMFAVPTGKRTGIFVMEYDPKNGGDESYKALIEQHGEIVTETNMSPSGGLHHVFVMPNFDFGSIHNKLWPGIDIKSTGGYHLVPPSKTEKGRYAVMQDMEPQPAPKWLLDKIFEYQSRNKWDSETRRLNRPEAKAYNPEDVSAAQAEDVRKTVEYWHNRISKCQPGSQNTLIYTGARVLFSLCFAGLLDEEDAQSYLEEACREGNHPQHRSLTALDSGRRAAESDPDPVEAALSNDLNILQIFALDDIGNANRVIFWRGNDVRYDVNREKYFTWAGKKWVHARDGRVKNIVEDVHSKIVPTESMFYSGDAMPPSEREKKAPKSYRELFCIWAASQRYSRKIADTSAILKGRESLWCEPDDFDLNPYHFNVNNGVVDLRTGQLVPHTREFMCSVISKDVDYDPSARAPHFERFLELTQPNREHRRYLQRLLGYTLIGEVIDQVFAVHIGGGGNGKGVFLDTMMFILGEYATTGQRDSFVRKSNSNRIPADIASMEGKRIVVVDELNDNQKMDEALLKDITGGGAIKAEAKNVNPWEYTPRFTLHFRTNHMPDLPSDESIVRRFLPVKWTVKPTSEEWDTFKDPHHSTPFNFLTKQESAGILNWILEGTKEYLANGLQVPEDLKVEAIDMLQENDAFLIFMHENAVANPGASIDGAKVYGTFKEWYDYHGFLGNPPTSRSLYKDIKQGKYKDRWEWSDVRNRFTFKGITLNTLLQK